ncbi:chorion peroxidase-like [Mercenaria mercenaria]|uniref:chorion peroxidase-like n=1 Tax=Mercenaria mercenaria TaxID=6596 RepID=UPI00234F85D4|nr:chorion peroxidase-like [Mercenaria mercenaria]
MGRCYYLIYLLTTGVLLLSLDLVTCQSDSCFSVAKLRVLEMFYNGDISVPYTCDDMQFIQHGIGCKKKCYSVTETLRNMFGCNPSFVFPQCPLRPAAQLAPVVDSECETETPSCTSGYEYRTIDGSCNNLWNPLWGKSDRVQNRLVRNAYDDGFDSPRTMGCSGQLPSAREVSNIIHSAGEDMKFDPRLSYMMMQMGQMLAHDMVLTGLVKRSDGEALQCCKEDMENPACFPIEVPQDDPYFPPGGCMNFGRSKARLDCKGIRQQVNSHTSYIDLSMVYGATDKEALFLRTLQGGLLKAIDKKLPADETDELCELSRPQHIPNYYCLLAGDERANEQPGLASIHTILMREHNRLAEQLSHVNPHWGDERLYQEARKINIAQWQNIVYSEYLPLVLGPYIMRKYNLEVKRVGYKDTYNPRTDATITNSFAVAGFRYGHSLVHRFISMMDFDMNEMISPEPLDHMFFEPKLYHSNGDYGPDYILLWTSTTKCPFSDRHLEPSIQRLLFRDKNNDSLDLAAVNIQR